MDQIDVAQARLEGRTCDREAPCLEHERGGTDGYYLYTKEHYLDLIRPVAGEHVMDLSGTSEEEIMNSAVTHYCTLCSNWVHSDGKNGKPTILGEFNNLADFDDLP